MLKGKLLLDLLIILVLIILGLMITALFVVNPQISDTNKRLLSIPKGYNTRKIATEVENAGLVKNRSVFIIWSKILGKDQSFHAGEYVFTEPLSVYGLIKRLSRGGSFSRNITIPEGLNIYQIGGLLRRQLEIDSLEWISSATDSVFMNSIGIPLSTAEGFLFPETYNIDPGIAPKEIIILMYNQFKETVYPLYSQSSPPLGLSLSEVITLASIIEEEAHVKSEQPIISGVYHNRLKKGILLQADPTTIYAMKKFDRPLLIKDLTFDSPYNTYVYPGLPPGPICNPGLNAVQAALYPAEVPFLFFVSNRDGTHRFSRNADEHNQAIRDIKEKLKNEN
ncbi:endolytic transglycosylase MltG [bacterium]|nr:endolytic transglycosylase MltG [bacterium]